MRLLHKEYLIGLLEFWLYQGKIWHVLYTKIHKSNWHNQGESSRMSLVLILIYKLNEVADS